MRQGGFSLLEVIAALAILGFSLTVTAVLLQGESTRVRRLAAREEALRALEATVETVRAGLVPLQSSTGQPVAGSPAELRLSLRVVPTHPSGLYRVDATARWEVAGHPESATLTSLVWRP